MRILFVCTGNICRSPLAEALLAARLPDGSQVTVASAGTHAVRGHGMDLAAAAVARDLGAEPARVAAHVAADADAPTLRAADLVLTATVAQREALLRVAPAGMRRTFTMREFARLGESLPARPTSTSPGPADDGDEVGDARELIARVAAQRGTAPAPAPGADDIGDPFGAPEQVMRRCGDAVSAAVDGIVRTLGLVTAAPVDDRR